MSDNPKEVEEHIKRQIRISGDGWLGVFDLLSPRKLGNEIAVLSQRFDCRVDEHFKTRRWALGFLRIGHKIGENGTKQMQLKDSHANVLPIPHKSLPNKVVGLKGIFIKHYGNDGIALLRRFHRAFASCGIKLSIRTDNDKISEFASRNIWPLLKDNICSIKFCHSAFHKWHKCVPSLLSDCPSLRAVSMFDGDIFPELPSPADDSAEEASKGHAVGKWLFSPCPDDAPRRLCCGYLEGTVCAKVERFKEAFANNNVSSLSANFIISFYLANWSFYDSDFPPSTIVPFDLTNKSIGKRLILRQCGDSDFLLSLCPIDRNEHNWARWEIETSWWRFDAGERWWNTIFIDDEEEVDEAGLFGEFGFGALMNVD